jgi:tetratricopeptide (TPR) repeat protein
MRLWSVYYFTLMALLCATTGCQSFQDKLNSSGKSLLGLKRPSSKVDLTDETLDPLGARNGNRLLWDDLSPKQLATTLKVRSIHGTDEQLAREQFEIGKKIYVDAISQKDSEPEGSNYQDQFLAAANHFRVASSRWPDSEIEEESLFFEGESFFFADHYVQSNRAFEKLVANFSGTRYLDMAEKRRFTIALYWLELAEKYRGPNLTDPKRPKTSLAGEARRVLHRIRIDDPTGKLADDATLALGTAYLKDKQYYEAADTFEDLRRNYPGSKHQFTTHMLELQARLQSYQGKSYDEAPLKKADELMKSIARQFPKEAREQLPYLEKQAALIRNQLAERDYAMGQFYENRGENRAAKYCYEQVAENYQDTNFGDSVKEQIAVVAELPPVPKQHAKWLVDLFPNDEEDEAIIASGDNESLFR